MSGRLDRRYQQLERVLHDVSPLLLPALALMVGALVVGRDVLPYIEAAFIAAFTASQAHVE